MTDQKDSCEYILVDLGELSRTRFGAAVADATLLQSESEASVHLDTGVIEKRFDCKRVDPVGTHVIYDEQGNAIGTTREVYQITRS